MRRSWITYLPAFLRTRLEGRDHLQQAVGNTGWLLLDRILRVSIGLVIGIWMARALGPAQFGQFNYALAFVALFSSIATLGLDGICVRNLVNSPDAKETILGCVAILKMAGAFVAILLCLGSICLVEPDNSQMRLLVSIISLGLLFQSFDAIDFWLQSKLMSKFVVLAKLPALLIFFALRVLLLLNVATLTALAWAQSLEVLAGGLGLIVVYQRLGNRLTGWRPALAYSIRLIRESWPLILAGLSVLLYMKIDVVMLGRMSGDRETGLYSAASKLSEGFYFLPMIISSSLAPLILKARASGHAAYMEGMLRLYVLMVRLSLGITVPLALASPLLIAAFFGPSYVDAVPILRVHIWAAIAVFLGVASSQYLTNEGRQKISLYRTLIGLAINVSLNFLLIPDFGAIGAAVATLISYSIATFSIFLFQHGREQANLMVIALNPLRIFWTR
jgi:PST family polysaccharide transporter